MEDTDVAPPATALTTPHTFGSGRALRPRTKVLPEQARNHNRALVLQTLFHVGAMSRADLSRETGLTRVTISDLIAELIDDGIVVERESKRPRGRVNRPRSSTSTAMATRSSVSTCRGREHSSGL